MISKKEVEHIAKLSRIKFSPEEIEKFQKDFSNILDYIGLLKKAKTAGLKISLSDSNMVRDDIAVPTDDATVEKLVNLAPNKESRQIKVKAILKS